jgi:bifunctional UDP-N-acetylglucosamine pyrophosphorylase/glucosamine-1-phosphate N-acetyltransferase
MHSDLPKVLHPLAGKPLLQHVVDTARELQPTRTHVVVGHGADQVRNGIVGEIEFHVQHEQLGTGHAVLQALPYCADDSTVLVLFGDVPLMRAATLQQLLPAADNGLVMLAAVLDDPTGYGRVLRGANGEFLGVVEQKDAATSELAIREVNTGVLAGPAAQLSSLLSRVGNANAQGEYYLPDALSMAVADGLSVAVTITQEINDVLGVNDRLQLEALERRHQVAQACELMRQGVAIRDRRRIDIRGELRCGRDVSIDLNTVFEGTVVLGDGVSIGANCILKDVEIAAGSVVHPFSHLESAVLGSGCSVGPYARLRPGTVLGDAARIGNFVETKNSTLGTASKANHLAYIGDSTIGEACNIGAGTITCNYDGANKHRTILGDRVFIGSNSTLVAPLSIESDGFVAAGSTVTKPIGTAQLAVSRARQRNIDGWRRPEKLKD